MKKFDPTDLKPCPHMRTLVSAHVDGNLTGIAEWYTKSHIKGCAQCSAALPFLISLKERLVELNVVNHTESSLSDERLSAIEADLLKIDAEKSTQQQ